MTPITAKAAPGTQTAAGTETAAGTKTPTGARTTAAADSNDDSPTAAIPAPTRPATTTTSTAPAAPAAPQAAPPVPRRSVRPPLATPPEESPLLELQRSVRRQQALARNPREDLVWQGRFAYTSGLIILGAFAIVSLPLWLVLYQSAGEENVKVADIMALCMMLLGGLLTCAAAWTIIIEMRGRVRMVDTLARTGEREAMAAPEIPVLDAPLESPALTRTAAPVEQPSWEASNAALAARAEAQQLSAAATLEASSKLLSSFGLVLKSFGQLPAQVAMLCVALALFVGATVLSLN